MVVIREQDATLKKILPPVTLCAGTTYIPSQFVLHFEYQGKGYLFNTLTKQCVEGRLPASASAGEGYDDLILAQFLVSEDRDECAYYNQISALMRAFTKNKGIPGYTILPTLGCNARCVYCYEEGMKQVTMTPDIVEQTIRFILDTHDGDKVRLYWFGGEPLLCSDTIDRVCAAMREAGLEYSSAMISNGSLITTKIVEKMSGDWKLGNIQISMDGAEKDYIHRKNYHANADYYHTVMRSVDLMSKAGVAVTIRCNVDEENWGGITRYLSDLRAAISNKENVRIYFCALNDMRAAENDTALWEKIRDLRPLIEEAGFQAAPFMGLGMHFRVNHCMADGGSVVIAPDGSLYLCEHCPQEACFGDIWHGVTNEGALKEFSRVDRTQDKCRNCSLLPNCTSFASCPVKDNHCRQVREMMAIDALKQMLDKEEVAGEDQPIC